MTKKLIISEGITTPNFYNEEERKAQIEKKSFEVKKGKERSFEKFAHEEGQTHTYALAMKIASYSQHFIEECNIPVKAAINRALYEVNDGLVFYEVEEATNILRSFWKYGGYIKKEKAFKAEPYRMFPVKGAIA